MSKTNSAGLPKGVSGALDGNERQKKESKKASLVKYIAEKPTPRTLVEIGEFLRTIPDRIAYPDAAESGQFSRKHPNMTKGRIGKHLTEMTVKQLQQEKKNTLLQAAKFIEEGNFYRNTVPDGMDAARKTYLAKCEMIDDILRSKKQLVNKNETSVELARKLGFPKSAPHGAFSTDEVTDNVLSYLNSIHDPPPDVSVAGTYMMSDKRLRQSQDSAKRLADRVLSDSWYDDPGDTYGIDSGYNSYTAGRELREEADKIRPSAINGVGIRIGGQLHYYGGERCKNQGKIS